MTTDKYDPSNEQHKLNLAIEIMSTLDTAGFKRDGQFEFQRSKQEYREHVYSREIRDGLFVLVYTSCSNHKKFYVTARAKGNDAIRVATVYKLKDQSPLPGRFINTRGLGKQKRVYRTGTVDAICDRMLERMRDGWRIGNNVETCSSCGAPKFKSKKGNLVCADVCWTRRG